MKYRIEYYGVCFLTWLLKILPFGFSSACTERIGDLCFLFMRKRRISTLQNVDRAYGNALSAGDKEKIARAAFRSAALSIMELFAVEKISREARMRFELVGHEHLENAYARGKGAVLVIAHIGSWEYLAFLPFLTGKPWSVVVKNIKNPYVNQRIDRLRRVMTVNPIPKAGSIKAVLKELYANAGVAILIDQWAGGEGLWIPFFGHETSTTSIPARLAKRTGCALVPAYCLRTAAGRYRIQIEPEIPLNLEHPHWELRTTEQLNGLLENLIRRHPEQWTWAHRRWKNKPAVLRESFRS